MSIDNLRPISLLPNLSKIFEKCLLFYYKKDIYNLYDPDQFGFRPKSSTQCAFISFHSQILNSLDSSSNKNPFITNFDLAKAFDTINHGILISTLLQLNLPMHFIKIINAYLQSRQQITSFNYLSSSPLPINSGVPQGSVLGPILFCLYIRSLCSFQSDSKCFKYADDTTFVLSIPKHSNLNLCIKNLISHIQTWCLSNKMSLNNSRTKIMQISSCSKNISTLDTSFDQLISDNITFVGYTISRDSSWTTHINSLLKKLSSRIHILRILKNSLSKPHLINVYFAYLQSLIDYLFPIFNNLTSHQINSIASITKRAHRIICGWNCSNNCLPNIEERCSTLASNLFRKVAKDANHILHDILPPRSSRSNRFLVPYTQSDKHLKSFLPQCVIAYNKNISNFLPL